jgi:hypothetical protein
MSEKPYRKYGASKGLPDFIKKRRKKMAEEEKKEVEAEEKKEEPKKATKGGKYDGGKIPKS